MLPKTRTILLLLPLVLILAACAGLKLPGTSSGASSGSGATPQPGQNQPGQPPNMTNQPIEQKLALGTLRLEGTENAVDTEQAKTLLPLWKAVKTLSSDSNTSAQEMDALYKQIQAAMTAGQVQAIKDMNLSQTDMQALMQKYGIQAPPVGNRNPNGTPAARTPSGGNSSGGSQNGGRDAGGPGGGFPPDMGGFGGPPPDAGGFGGAQPNAQGTPRARGTPGQGGRTFRGGMNMMFVDPLIKVLQERAGVQVTPTAQK